MDTQANVQSISKPRAWVKVTTRLLVVLFALWLGLVAYMWNIMHRPPEAFAHVMMHMPWQVFLVVPFETMWTRARAGIIRVGDSAPDFSLQKIDKTGVVRL